MLSPSRVARNRVSDKILELAPKLVAETRFLVWLTNSEIRFINFQLSTYGENIESQWRMSSATDQAWATVPLGAWGASPSKISETEPMQACC